MLDGRIAQFIMPASIIDDRPDLVLGPMAGMVVLGARGVNTKDGQGIHYLVWHPQLPHMPLHAVKPGEPPPYPWITVETNNNPNDPNDGRWRYVWFLVGSKPPKAVLTGEWTNVTSQIDAAVKGSLN